MALPHYWGMARSKSNASIEWVIADDLFYNWVISSSLINKKPSFALELKRIAVREATGLYRATNLRIFGSVLHGLDHDGSDIDILVDALPGATLFDLGDLQVELEELLGVPVDLLTPQDLPIKFRQQDLQEAIPI